MRDLVDSLKISEWSWVEWIGRYFTLDNDYGEHWFDNWDEREALEGKAEAMGYASELLLVVNPARMMNGKDGPCHTAEERKQFWTDVLRNLKLSLQTLFNEAWKCSAEHSKDYDQYGLASEDISKHLQDILNRYNSKTS